MSADRSLIARVAVHTRWARTGDRVAATLPARTAFLARFEREVDPDGVLDAAERELRARHLLSAHMSRLALRRHKT